MDIRKFTHKKRTLATADFARDYGTEEEQLWTIECVWTLDLPSDAKPGELDEKAAVKFVEHPQAIVLNKDRSEVIGTAWGWTDDNGAYEGKRLLVSLAPNSSGQTRWMFRFRIPNATEMQAGTVPVKQWKGSA